MLTASASDDDRPRPPMRPGRGAHNRIAGSLGEQLARIHRPRPAGDVTLDLAKAERLLRNIRRRLAGQ